MPNIREKFAELIGSSTPLILARSDEPEDIETEVTKLCKGDGYTWNIWTFDCDMGIQTDDGSSPAAEPATKGPAGPLAAVAPKPQASTAVSAAILTLAKFDNKPKQNQLISDDDVEDTDPTPTIMIVRNLHLFWKDNAEGRNVVIQRLANFYRKAKETSKYIIGVSPPGTTVPDEISPMVTIVDHELPKKNEFDDVLAQIEFGGEPIKLTAMQQSIITAASCGLTRGQAEAAYGISLMRHKTVLPEVVEEYKNEILNTDQMLTQYKGEETFDDIGGNDAAKEFLIRAMNPEARQKAKKPIRAVALVGPPGTGKTLMAKALGNHCKIKTFAVDVGKTKSKWMGESEAGVRKLYSRMDAMAPIVAYYDEINEQLGSGGGEEHSVDKHIVQATLVWLNDHTSDVFVIMTANDVRTMHMALLRAGRVNAIYYVGLPSKKQKQAIWNICLNRYGIELEDNRLPNDEGWAGAEINECCAMADALGCSIIDSAKYIIPSSVRASEQIESLKKWADGRVLDAETGLIYSRTKEAKDEATGLLLPIGQRSKRKVRTGV